MHVMKESKFTVLNVWLAASMKACHDPTMDNDEDAIVAHEAVLDFHRKLRDSVETAGDYEHGAEDNDAAYHAQCYALQALDDFEADAHSLGFDWPEDVELLNDNITMKQ